MMTYWSFNFASAAYCDGGTDVEGSPCQRPRRNTIASRKSKQQQQQNERFFPHPPTNQILERKKRRACEKRLYQQHVWFKDKVMAEWCAGSAQNRRALFISGFRTEREANGTARVNWSKDCALDFFLTHNYGLINFVLDYL